MSAKCSAWKAGLASTGPVGDAAKQPHPDEWQTRNHAKGYCAMYGICGDRLDGGALNCPYNIPAPKAEPDAERILSTICPEFWADSGAAFFKAAEVHMKSVQAVGTRLHSLTSLVIRPLPAGCSATQQFGEDGNRATELRMRSTWLSDAQHL